MKHVVATLLACLVSAPSVAATFTYTGPLFTPATVGTSGFKRVVLQFTVPGTVQPNTTYTLTKLATYRDGLNKLPQITSLRRAARFLSLGHRDDRAYRPGRYLDVQGPGCLRGWSGQRRLRPAGQRPR